MTRKNNTNETPKVIVAGGRVPGVHAAIVDAGADCVLVQGDEMISYLRANHLDVLLVVLVADGADEAAQGTLCAIKEWAPATPVVFLDLNGSADSEMQVRRNGVHFYSHTPPSREELTAVIAKLASASCQRPALAGANN